MRREDKIILSAIGDNTFEVTNRDGGIVLGADDNYFIYLKNVNFKADGTMEGRYLGEATDSLIDDFCKNVSYQQDVGYTINGGAVVRTARMVAVNNKDKAVIIIEN